MKKLASIILGKTPKDEKDEIHEFLIKKPIFPCFLISKNNGKIEINKDGFEKENIPIQIMKENSLLIKRQESKEDFQMVVDNKISEDISFYGTLKFDANMYGNVESARSNKLFVVEYLLYSLNIKEEDLSFSKFYLDKFRQVASNSYLSDIEKSQKLDEIFSSTGYYIPRKIYIGGMMISHENQFTNSQAMNYMGSLDLSVNIKSIDTGNTSLSSEQKSKFNEIYKYQSNQIIGGDRTAETFEDWIKSINLENSNVIECTNIIKAKDILDDDLKKQLEKPLELIEDKCLRRKNYLRILNEKKKLKVYNMKGDKDVNRGECKENNESNKPLIRKESSLFFTPVVYFPPIYYKEFHKEFNDIIIGFEIIDNRKDGHNGEWTIKNNPLGNKEITIEFASCFLREQNYTIDIYLMEIPK